MINFVDINPNTILSDMISSVETELGETLHSGDEKRLFIQGLAPIVVAIINKINDTANQNFLSNARDDVLNELGEELYSTTRQAATKASCKGIAKLSAVQTSDITISANTKVIPKAGIVFKVKTDAVISAGKTQVEVTLEAAETGTSYNGYALGKINYIVDPIPYVQEIYNTEISAGGADIEDDDSYRERARLAMESLSTAGPTGAYEYFALSADNSISSVKVTSPSPGVVKILVLLENGELPTQEILDSVYEVCSAKDKRPLTDNVQVSAPEVVSYDISLTYYLDKNYPTSENSWRESIEGENLDFSDGAVREYINWQHEEIGKSINPDELKYLIQNAASYTANSRTVSGVKRIVLTSPSYTIIEDNQIAKVNNITVTYGGME